MTDRGDAAKAASRILRERAMAILRDTRSRIDPALLAAMKERLSPAAGVNPPPEQGRGGEPQLKQGLFKRDYKPPSGQVSQPEVFAEDQVDENGMVPVDRQKIAQIVLQYMKNREDQQKH